MKLNLTERLRLLEILPVEGNRMNLKILRKLTESLSFSEAEIKLVPAVFEFVCGGIRTDGDNRTRCEYNVFVSEGNPKCELHPDEPMQATGNWRITDMTPMLDPANEKDIFMGAEAVKLTEAPLKAMEDTGKLTEAYTSLYDKFFPPREEEADAGQGEKG